MKQTILASLALAMTASIATAGGEGWMTDFEAAKKKAAEEKKDLLLDFTGSDWCPPCKALTKNILSKEEFKKAASEKYILVELDFPRDKSKIDEATQKQNQELQQKYNIKGYPTILLVDAKGLPYAQTGYKDGGPKEYLEHLGELQANRTTRDEAFAAAAKLDGVAKAEALVKALKELPETQLSHYQHVIDDVSKLDPEDKTGFVKNQKYQAAYAALMGSLRGKEPEAMITSIDAFIEEHKPEGENLSTLTGIKLQIQVGSLMRQQKADDAIALIDKHIADNKLEGEEKQSALGIKMGPLLNSGKFDEAGKVIDEIIAADPDSKTAEFAKNFKPRLAKMKAEEEAKKKAAEAPKEEENKPAPAE